MNKVFAEAMSETIVIAIVVRSRTCSGRSTGTYNSIDGKSFFNRTVRKCQHALWDIRQIVYVKFRIVYRILLDSEAR